MLPWACKLWDTTTTDSGRPNLSKPKGHAQVRRLPTTVCAALLWAPLAQTGQALTLDLPPGTTTNISTSETLARYPLPIGPFANGQMQTRAYEGPMVQTAWQIDAPGVNTLQLLAPLRAQLLQAGYSVTFECDAPACGGFDFRFGTMIIPEPEMHVDLGDYRFLAATKGPQAVSLIVSRSAALGFVQLTQIGEGAAPVPLLTAAATARTGQIALALPQTSPTSIPIDTTSAPSDLASRIAAGEAVALDDLVFASSASTLSEGTYPSLVALADWMTSNPDLRVALVGHTDASGSLAGNIALSRQRAQSVRQRLIDRYDIPGAQVDAEGVGYLAPRVSNLTPEGREKNRRVEVMMTSTD